MMDFSMERKSPHSSEEKEIENFSSSCSTPTRNRIPSIVTDVDKVNDRKGNELSSSASQNVSGQIQDPTGETPKHCNKTSRGNSGINRPEMKSPNGRITENTSLQASGKKRGGVSVCSPRRSQKDSDLENIRVEDQNYNRSSHPGQSEYPGNSRHPYDCNPSAYQGPDHQMVQNRNARNNSDHGSNYRASFDNSGISSHHNGRYYEQGRNKSSSQQDSAPTPSSAPNHYGHGIPPQRGHGAQNNNQSVSHGGRVGQQFPAPYPPPHDSRGHYHHEATMSNGIHSHNPPSYYNNSRVPSSEDYRDHGNGPNSNHYQHSHVPPPRRVPPEQYPSHFGRANGGYGNGNNLSNPFQPPIHLNTNSSRYPYHRDENPSYGSRSVPLQPSSSYASQPEQHPPISHAHNDLSQQKHLYPNGAQRGNDRRNHGGYPPNRDVGGQSSSNQQVGGIGMNAYKDRHHPPPHQTANEEPLNYPTQYNDNLRGEGAPPTNHNYSSHHDHHRGSKVQSPSTRPPPETSHYHNNYRKNTNNFARTVSSSFEVVGGGNGSDGQSGKSSKTSSSPQRYEPGQTSQNRSAKTTKVDPKPLPKSNSAFAQDLAVHHGHFANNHDYCDVDQHMDRTKEPNSPDQASDSSWHQLNKVASIGHHEFERRNGREFGDRLIEDGMELPLNLQSNPSNLESLASLSSVASIQEQLPLDSTDPKDDGSAPPVPLQPRDEDGRGRTLSYGSVGSSLFHQKQEEVKPTEAPKSKEAGPRAKRSRENDKEGRDPHESGNDDNDNHKDKPGEQKGRTSPGTVSIQREESSPTKKKRPISKKRRHNEEPSNELSKSSKESPINLLSSNSPSALSKPSGTSLEVPKFTNKKEHNESRTGNEKQQTSSVQMLQPKAKYPSSQNNITNASSHQNIQGPKSKDGSFPNVQSDNSSFTSTEGKVKGGERSYYDIPPSYSYSQDSRDGGSNKGFVPFFSTRPGSSCSGSITVMGPISHERTQSSGGGLGLGSIMMMPSMPSWEIQNQDSFTSAVNTEVSGGSSGERVGATTTGSVGNKSTGSGAGLPLMASFSFSNDYNMLSGNAGYTQSQPSANNIDSEERGIGNRNHESGPTRSEESPPYLHRPPPPSHKHHDSLRQESRNQSFDSYGPNSGGNHHPPPNHAHNGPHRNFNIAERGRNNDNDHHINNNSHHHPYGRHPAHDHHYPYPNSHRGGGPEERTSVGGSFGGPAPPHHVTNGPPHHGPPRHYPSSQGRRGNNTSPPWGGPPPTPHHYSNHGSSHIPHGPVPSHSFGSTASSRPHYNRPFLHRPGSPSQYPQHRAHHAADEFQPPPREYMHHSKPPPTVFIVSNPNRGHHNDPTMSTSSLTKGVYNWSKDDDSRLTDLMKKYRNPKDWDPIAKEHGRGKSAKECHERWIRYLKPGVRKGQWQDHEDAIVVEAVTTSAEQPFTRWSDLAQRLPGRVGKQIRDRWVNHLNPAINHMPFTREDDLLLFKGHEELGKRWVEISSKYFNSTRSENHIKNRWYSASFKKFIANEFGPDAYTGGSSGTKKNTDKREEPTVDKGVTKKMKADTNLSSDIDIEKPKIEVKEE